MISTEGATFLLEKESLRYNDYNLTHLWREQSCHQRGFPLASKMDKLSGKRTEEI